LTTGNRNYTAGRMIAAADPYSSYRLTYDKAGQAK
jgi:hypothetical protein